MHHLKTYTIAITKTNGGYRAACPGLPACAAAGSTSKEALERVEDLIKDRIRHAVVSRQPVPVDRTSVKFLWVDTEEFLV
jgi:predicted RNase H-like HicB family nuclease